MHPMNVYYLRENIKARIHIWKTNRSALLSIVKNMRALGKKSNRIITNVIKL